MYITSIKQQLLAKGEQLVPCTAADVETLEKHYQLTLPLAYQEFLLTMGRYAGSFLAGADYQFPTLLELRSWVEEVESANPHPRRFAFPEDAFIFYNHGGYRIAYFQVTAGDNPPVYLYSEGIDGIERRYEAFTDFLEHELNRHHRYKH